MVVLAAVAPREGVPAVTRDDWHEVVVDDLTYRFRDEDTAETFRLAVEAVNRCEFPCAAPPEVRELRKHLDRRGLSLVGTPAGDGIDILFGTGTETPQGLIRVKSD